VADWPSTAVYLTINLVDRVEKKRQWRGVPSKFSNIAPEGPVNLMRVPPEINGNRAMNQSRGTGRIPDLWPVLHSQGTDVSYIVSMQHRGKKGHDVYLAYVVTKNLVHALKRY